MPKYLVLLNLTDQGAKTVKGIPNKRDQSRETAKKFGVERKQAWRPSAHMTLSISMRHPMTRQWRSL